MKGGIATLGDGIYVSVNLPRNTVIVQELSASSAEPTRSAEWTGAASDQREVVFIYERRVVASSKLPASFDLTKAIVVSFEVDRVRFFDFRRGEGGYYQRSK